MEHHPAGPLCKSRSVEGMWRWCEGGLGMGMPLWKVSGFLRHLILTPVSSVTLPQPRHCHGHASLKCFTLVSLLPSDSCPGLHDRHHFQVHSATKHHALGSVSHGGPGIPGLASPVHGGSGGFAVICGLCLWPLPSPSPQYVSNQRRHHRNDHHCCGVYFSHHLLLPDQGEGLGGPSLASPPPFLI